MAGTFVPVPTVAELQMVYKLHGQIIENTFYFRLNAGEWDATSLLALANHAITRYAALKNGQGNDLVFNKALATALFAQDAPGVEVDLLTGNTGASGGGSAPGNVTLAVKRLTGLRGRSYRGRIFYPGIPLAWINPSTNSLIEADRAACVQYIANFSLGVATDSTSQECVVSRYSGKLPSGKPAPRAAGVVTDLTGWAADGDLDSMRRRLNGRGQ